MVAVVLQSLRAPHGDLERDLCFLEAMALAARPTAGPISLTRIPTLM